MRTLFFILWCVLFEIISQQASAQSWAKDRHYTDSMEIVLQAARTDAEKAGILDQLSDYWSEKDSVKSVHYALHSLQLSKGHPYYVASAHFYIGGAYFNKDIEKSKREYLITIDLLKKDSSLGALSLRSRSWHNYGALLERQDSNRAFMAILIDHAIPLARLAGDTLHEAFDYFSVAQVFSNILNYNKAIDYYRKAINLVRQRHQPPAELAMFYISLAKNYIYNKQFPPAKPCLDSAKNILTHYTPSRDRADYYMVLGMYYSRIRQFKTAFANLDTAFTLFQSLHLPYEANSVLFQKYNAYTEAKMYPEAKQTLLKIYNDPVSSSRPENKLMFLYDLAQTEAKMGHVKSAYGWLSQYASLADSLNSKRIKSEIEGLEIKYESEKKQREILTLQNENKRQLLVLQKNRLVVYLLIAGILFLLLISLIIYMRYRNKKISSEQQIRLHEQQLRQIAQDQQLEVYNAMLDGQEQERRRMARDLHDGLGGMLAGLKLQLSDIAAHHHSERDMEIYKVISQLDNSVQELRRIARNMMPETLIRFGVETALKDLCDSLQSPSMRVEFQSYQLNKNLSQPVQITIYRIIQELLTNVVRHARASNILVQCSQNENRVFITVEDDGQGFEIGSLKHRQGIGLSNIQNRINYLKGRLDIQTTPGEGTIINVEVNAEE